MVSKFGKKFENVSKLFDHAAQNGSNYLNGHCFVSIMLCVPVLDHDKISYLSVPLGYRMWQPNLDLIGNARIDSVMYDLAPARTGRRGRPAKHGKRLCVETDLTFSKEKIGDYYTGVRRVFTKIFGDREVLAYVTDTEKGNGTKRLFFSTIFSEDLKVFCTEEEHSSSDQTDHDPVNYIPLLLYAFRWKIEIGDYEQKTFWSFCDYMVRSRKGIETHIKSETMIKALKQLICQQVCHL